MLTQPHRLPHNSPHLIIRHRKVAVVYIRIPRILVPTAAFAVVISFDFEVVESDFLVFQCVMLGILASAFIPSRRNGGCGEGGGESVRYGGWGDFADQTLPRSS